MINLDFIKLFNDLSGLILISFIIFVVFEVAKLWFPEIPDIVKKPFAIYLGVLVFIITSIISYVNGNTTPIISGLFHGFVYGILEGSWFIFIKGIGFLIERLIELIKNKIGSKKK